jgi:hypothetical protein
MTEKERKNLFERLSTIAVTCQKFYNDKGHHLRVVDGSCRALPNYARCKMTNQN